MVTEQGFGRREVAGIGGNSKQMFARQRSHQRERWKVVERGPGRGGSVGRSYTVPTLLLYSL